jgi:hypothetical protein
VVFVSSCGGAIRRVDELAALDAATGDVLYHVPLYSSLDAGQIRLVGQTLWIAENDPKNAGFIRLLPVDAGTGEQAGPPFEIERGAGRFGPHAMFPPHVFFAAGEGSLWLTDSGAGEVIRVGLPITGTGMPTPEASVSGSSPTQSPDQPVEAVRVILDHEIDVPSYDRVITPGLGEPPFGEEAAVDEAWRAVGEGTHPAAVVDVYVEWNGRPMWVVSFQGGDVCPPIMGPPPGTAGGTPGTSGSTPGTEGGSTRMPTASP